MRQPPGMDHAELVAREQIRDLVARYNANGDAGRFEPMLDLFAEDAVMHIPSGTHRGRDEIAAMFTDAAAKTGEGDRSRAAFIRHFTATLQIDLVSAETATSRCYYQVLTGRGLDHWGRYLDRYRLVDGQWRFTERKVTVDGFVAGGWGDQS